jgi:hypothetical protein
MYFYAPSGPVSISQSDDPGGPNYVRKALYSTSAWGGISGSSGIVIASQQISAVVALVNVIAPARDFNTFL